MEYNKERRKKERKATRCSLNICKMQWNIIKKERKKERSKKERKKERQLDVLWISVRYNGI